MKKLLISLVLCCITWAAQAQGLTQAEKLYQEADFASALPQYQAILQTATGNTLYQAQLRVAACQYGLSEYLTAAQTMFNYPLPQDPVWKARFLLYRIYLAQQTANQYHRILQPRAIEENADMAQWTRQEWHAHIEQDFEQLWALRANLINAPMEKETLLFNVKDTDMQRIPTLFDFVVQQWSDFLTETVMPLTARSYTYLDGTVTPFAAQAHRANKLADVLQTAYLLEGNGRQNARLFWKTDYLLLPFQQPQLFEIKQPERARQKALTQLNQVSGYGQGTRWWKKIKQVFSPSATLYGRSYAAYQTAQWLYGQDKRADALAVCRFAAKELGTSYYTNQCADLAEQITRAELSWGPLPQAVHPQHPTLSFSTRNITQLYARVYPLTRSQLEQFYQTNYSRTLNNWSDLTNLSSQALQTILSSHTTYQTARLDITPKNPYFEQEDTLTLPALPPGFYAVLATYDPSFDPAKAPITGRIVNSTDLALFVTAAIEDNPDLYVWTLSSRPHTRSPQVFHLYTVNLKTGQPQPNTRLDLITAWKGSRQTAHTNAQGVLHLPRTITLDGHTNNSYFINAWAQQGSSAAFSAHPYYFHYYPARPVRLFAQTDRAVYRPGQKVHLSVQAFENTPRGFTVLPGKTATIRVRGANGKQIFESAVTLNEFGTAQTQFTLPEKDTLLGNYSLDISCKAGKDTYHVYHSFEVEEYKRPEYEISFDEPKTPLAYHVPATLSGKAAYYVGTPLQQATVHYTVTRREYIPPFYWWRTPGNLMPEQVAQGTTHTDDQGRFELTWTPTPATPQETATQYEVYAEVFDATGRPIKTTRTYRVSQYPRLFKLEFTQGFYDAQTPAPLAKLTLTDTDGHPITGAVTVRLSLLQDTPSVKGHTLDEWYQEAPVAKTISSRVLTFHTPAPQTLQLPALPQGIYRLTLRAEQAQEQAVVFVVAGPQAQLNLPAIALPQHNTYYPGQTARILLGAGALTGTKQVETTYKREFLQSSEQLPGGLSIYEYPITDAHRGGLAFTWFGASNYTFYQAATTLNIPFDNQALTVTTDVPQLIKPGQNVRWTLHARNAQNAPVTGQASITVYDKSLDYYAQKENPFTLNTLFAQTAAPTDVAFSRLTGHTATLWHTPHAATWQPAPTLPSLTLHMTPRFYTKATYGANAMLMHKSAPLAFARGANLDDAKAAFSADTISPQAALESAAVSSPEEPADSLRTDFAETAYFNTLLPVTNGKATLSFQMPQALTTWNVLGYVLTKNAQLGSFTANTITRKDFMVRLHLPRFYREGDKGQLQVSVMNLTNRKLTVPVTLSVTQEGRNQAQAFGLAQLTKTVTVAANATAFARWDVTAPAAPGLYQLTAVARNGSESDGEQQSLPVLPARSRLLAATHAALRNGTNTLRLKELEEVPDAKAELATLTLTPSLALAVINKMPHLLESPYHDLISTLNRYVPLAVVNRFYTTYPALAQAVKKLPGRTGLTAPWNETDPLRLTLLEQTPWLRAAQGNPVSKAAIINLFDEKVVSAKLEQERARVQQFQQADGSFSWFPGGPGDTYLTLRVLEAYGQALRFGVDIAQDSTERALAYIVPAIEQKLKQDKSGSASNVAFALYAAYTLSAFPANWGSVSAARPYIQKWVDYADTQSKFMTPLGQIYAAAVYHRLSDDLKANRYLDVVLARLKYNDLTGAYFAPEAQSWVWYQDTLTTQTATLKTLLEIRPQSDKIDPLLQWLLFNKQVTGWDDPAATAQAVFVLLDVMQQKGALSAPATYHIQWADTQDKRTFEPFDWTAPLQWVKQPPQLSNAVDTATITKQSKMTDFASLNVIYTTTQAKASAKGVLNVTREYFVRTMQDGTPHLRPVKNMEEIHVADEIEVQLTLNTQSAFDYVLLTDPKPAGFESADISSAWTWNPISMYREVRDADTNFFIQHLPAGTVRVSYVLRPTVPGQFHAKPAQVQSLYAPQFGAHAAAEKLQVAN